MKKSIELNINGQGYEVAVDTHRTLLEVLREDFAFTGTKEGCGLGECGTCTVLINGKAVNACTVLAVETVGKEIFTVEGLAQGEELHPLQKSFVDHGAIQCGFCTPGMLMSAKALLENNKHPTENEIKTAISGNLCRCTGYVKIIDAIKAASHPLSKD